MDIELHPSAETTSNLYETDFYAWTQEQAKFLQEKAWEHLDIVNLVEEIESLGKQVRQELRNRLGILLGHLLKWEFQPNKRSKSWFFTLREQRREIGYLLDENPSLKPYLPEALQKDNNQTTDISGLSTLTNLTALNLSNNQITDISGFLPSPIWSPCISITIE